MFGVWCCALVCLHSLSFFIVSLIVCVFVVSFADCVLLFVCLLACCFHAVCVCARYLWCLLVCLLVCLFVCSVLVFVLVLL